jgi:3-mercaptopyruvate sulfurtransferase SseA
MLISRTLIDAATAAHLPAHDVLFVDARFDLNQPGGRDPGKGDQDYALSHIPGAVRADLDRDLADMATPSNGRGRHPLPSAASFSSWLSRAGWRPDLQVVVYDAAGGSLAAARFWWLARLAGIDNVAVLDGGWPAWTAAALPTDNVVPLRESTAVHVVFDDAGTVDAKALAEGVASGHLVLLDARAAPRYRGEVEPLDPVATYRVPETGLSPTTSTPTGASARPRSYVALSAQCSAHITPRTSCTCVVRASPPATTCWRWSTRASAVRGCTPRHGAAGSATPPAAWPRAKAESRTLSRLDQRETVRRSRALSCAASITWMTSRASRASTGSGASSWIAAATPS